jgi:hypothetical protein
LAVLELSSLDVFSGIFEAHPPGDGVIEHHVESFTIEIECSITDLTAALGNEYVDILIRPTQ